MLPPLLTKRGPVMNKYAMAGLMLQARFALQRVNWSWLLALSVLALVAAAQLLWLPRLQAQIQAKQASATRLAKELAKPAPAPRAPVIPMAERNLNAFYAALGERAYLEQQNQSFFALAEKAGISLRQGEYKLAHEKIGKYYAYSVQLPVKGTYSQIIQFSEQSLQQMPFASLDEMNFKREQIANRSLEAKLKFTLYLTETLAPIVEENDVPDMKSMPSGKAASASASAGKANSSTSSPLKKEGQR